jgi:hypothetical protein
MSQRYEAARVSVNGVLYGLSERAVAQYQSTVSRQQSVLNKIRLQLPNLIAQNPNWPDNVDWQTLRRQVGIRGNKASVEGQRRLIRQALIQERQNFPVTQNEINRWLRSGDAWPINELHNIYTNQTAQTTHQLSQHYGIGPNPVVNRIDWQIRGQRRFSVYEFRTLLDIDILQDALDNQERWAVVLVETLFSFIEEKHDELWDVNHARILDNPMLIFECAPNDEITVPATQDFDFDGWLNGNSQFVSIPRSPIPIAQRTPEFKDLLDRLVGIARPRSAGSDEIEQGYSIFRISIVFTDFLGIQETEGWWLL